MTYELIGIAGTILILIAFSCNTERQIRIFDAAGAVLFVVYGILTRTWSTAVLNALLIVIQIVKLRKR